MPIKTRILQRQQNQLTQKGFATSRTTQKKDICVTLCFSLCLTSLVFGCAAPEEEVMFSPKGRCQNNDAFFYFELKTDDYAFETRWELNNTSTNERVLAGPPAGRNYRDDTIYRGSQCLPPGTYELTLYDNASDGICCSYGRGHYKATLDDETLKNGGQFGDQETTTFVVSGGHTSGDSNFRIRLQTDRYAVADNTRWELVDGETRERVGSGNNLENNKAYTVELELSQGTYELTLFDDFGDGFIGNDQGHVTIFLNDEEMFTEKRFGQTTRMLRIGHPDMTPRDTEWLNAHNNHRKNYDPDGDNLPYVPLRWSPALAAEAQAWAEALLTDELTVVDENGNEVVKTACNPQREFRRSSPSELHDLETGHGENITTRIGSGGWAEDRSPAQLVNGPWARSAAHNRQMVWRPTHYIGCGSVAQEPDPDYRGFNCRIYVCRFARPGNCVGSSWKDDISACGPSPCPPDGCYGL
jgi:hypothetical protein